MLHTKFNGNRSTGSKEKKKILRLFTIYRRGSHLVMGSAVAWWLMPRTPDPEVGGSSPTRVKTCCVLEQDTLTP